MGTVKIGSWLHRQLTQWNTLARRQQGLLALHLTPQTTR
jgi:hypothetical protein